jgi:hypothetical protein
MENQNRPRTEEINTKSVICQGDIEQRVVRVRGMSFEWVTQEWHKSQKAQGKWESPGWYGGKM